MTQRSTLKRLARRAVSSAAFFGGYCFLSSLTKAGRGVRILCYHSISDLPANSFAVSTSDFARQMRFLAERHTIISLDQVADLIRGGRPIPPRTVAVTVDDGYSDAYTHAYPILKRFAIPATIFLPVEFIGAGSSDRVTSKLPQTDFLSWDQVREMSPNGITFGSHTLTHDSLTKLTRQATQYQLEHSKARLEMEIGKAVTGFSYPYGRLRDFNPEVGRLVSAAGYGYAVTGMSGVNDHQTDLFALRRTKVERDDHAYVFEKAMRGALDPWVVVDRFGGFLQGSHR